MKEKVKIVLRNVKTSSQKMREVIKGFKCLSVGDGVVTLKLLRSKRVDILRNLLNQVIESLHSRCSDPFSIKIEELRVDKTSSYHLPNIRAKGRIDFIEKQTCQVSLRCYFQRSWQER
jgi:ribosomal protein L22